MCYSSFFLPTFAFLLGALFGAMIWKDLNYLHFLGTQAAALDIP